MSLFRRKRKRRDQTSLLGNKESVERPPDFNLPQIPPPMSLLNSVQNNHDGRVVSNSVSASLHHNSSQQHNSSGLSGIKQLQSGRQGVYVQEESGLGSMQVKPEVQQQHSLDSIENANQSRSPVTPGSQRTQASLSGHGMEGSIMDACSRYGLSGSISSPTSPECNASSAYGGAGLNHQQSQYPSGGRSSSLSSSYGHCVPNPFNFSVNNLIHRNHKI